MPQLTRMTIPVLFLTLFLTLGAFQVKGWDDSGHKITGYIAWQRMSPKARENILKILRSAPEDSHLGAYYQSYGVEKEETRKLEFFMFATSWPDVVRDRDFPVRYKKYHKGDWHYDDTFWKQVDGTVELLTGFEGGGQGVPRLKDFDALIRDPASSNADKAVAIAWILHIVGDLHQPLHTSARVTDLEPKGDQGGNLFLLSPAGTPRPEQYNLHRYWDSIIERNNPIKDKDCERGYLETIAKKIISENPYDKVKAKLNMGKFGEWQQESFQYNASFVFTSDLKRNSMPPDHYNRNAYRLAKSQLALAGYRLGDMLDSVFGEQGISPVGSAQSNVDCQIIRKVRYPIFKRLTPANLSKTEVKAALLNVCPSGPAARPTILVGKAGKQTTREFEVVQVFKNDVDAKNFAAKENISDIDLVFKAKN